MKILQVHKYCSRKRGAGSVTAFFETVNLLKRKKQEVVVFSMKDVEGQEEFDSKNFAPHFDINRSAGFWKKIQLAGRSIFNFQAQKSLEKFLKDFQPDVAHIHNVYHYLTPSIFFTLKKHKIPMVLKLSDYKLICPNYKLFNQGKICQKCQGGKYFHCFLGRCLKNSFVVSLVAMLEAYVHRILHSYDKIDLFLAPSIFMKEKCVQFGIAKERIEILRNTIDQQAFSSLESVKESEKNYFLYYGRISEEKGLRNLIQATAELKKLNQLGNNKLALVGHGPAQEALEKLTRELGLEKEVEFWGFKQGAELKEIVASSKFVVLPSLWFDNSPLIISEAQLLEKPVLVSCRGGSGEMLIDQKTGWIFDPENQADFVSKLSQALKLEKPELQKMGQAGRENILQLNSEEKYYTQLMEIYQRVIKNYSK